MSESALPAGQLQLEHSSHKRMATFSSMLLSLSQWHPAEDDHLLCRRCAGPVRGRLPGGWPQSPGNPEGQPDTPGTKTIGCLIGPPFRSLMWQRWPGAPVCMGPQLP